MQRGLSQEASVIREPYVNKDEFKEWISKKPLRSVAKVISRLSVLAETKVYLLWEQPSNNQSMGMG